MNCLDHKSKIFVLLLCFFLISENAFSQNSENISANFIDLADKITANASEIKNIWPGFWSNNEPFLFMKYDNVVHVYNLPKKPNGDYKKIQANRLPNQLKGKAYTKKSYLPEYKDQKRSFPGLYKVNGKMIYALEPKGSDDFHKLDFYLHESFHYYQREKANWEETAGDTISIKFKTMVVDSIEQVTNPQYKDLQNYERKMLSKTLDLEKKDQIVENLKKALVSKRTRDVLLSRKARDLIDRYQRREGTANYTGLHASAAANNYSMDSVYVELKSNLNKPFDEFSSFPAKDQRFLRWPQYAIGASYGIMLDKLEVKNWKKKIANGATFYGLISDEISVSDAEFERIKNEILDRELETN